ncbi:MAG: hypothetical protein H7Z20_07760 [Bdellovibrio sp.]|nr:hypothetical protein [Methylotenera sp.]
MANENKKIVTIEVLHLDDLGYGPEGKLTRRQWREECYNNYQSGDNAFLEWQNSWLILARNNKRQIHF